MAELVRENIEWVNFRWDHAPDTTRRRVLLIGDSIANGYHGTVSARLEGFANVDLMATSKAINDPAIRRETQYATEDYSHALIHFNNGLHGWHLSVDEYAAALRGYVKFLRDLAPDAKLVWATSTPMTVNGQPETNCPEMNPKVLARNAAAAPIMQEFGIPVNDLYSLVVGKAELRSGDAAHFSAAGRELQGKQVAEVIRKALD